MSSFEAVRAQGSALHATHVLLMLMQLFAWGMLLHVAVCCLACAWTAAASGLAHLRHLSPEHQCLARLFASCVAFHPACFPCPCQHCLTCPSFTNFIFHLAVLLLLLLFLQAAGQFQGSRGVLIDGVFGLFLDEKVKCHTCGKETHKVPKHYEHLIVVNSASLTLAAMAREANMAQLLADLFNQEQKFCDKDEGGCGASNVGTLVCCALRLVLVRMCQLSFENVTAAVLG